MKKYYNLKKSVMWKCCFFPSVTFCTLSHSLIRFFAFSFYHLECQIDTCQRSPCKKNIYILALIHWYLSIFYALSLLTAFWEISGFIHQIVFWNSFCLVISNHGFQFLIGWHIWYFQIICFWNKILIIANN